MATYFVASGGSNTSPYDTWAKAATSLQTALTAASGGTDIVVIQYNAVPTADKEISADGGYTTANHVNIISASNDGGSAYTPRAMSTDSDWLGNSTTTYRIGIGGGNDDKVYVYGLTFRVSGTGSDELRLGGMGGSDMHFEDCYLWQGTTNASSSSIIVGAQSTENFMSFKDCTFRFGNTAQQLTIYSAGAEFIDCSVATAGSAPANFINPAYGNAAYILFEGCDLSHITGNLVGNTGVSAPVQLHQCKLGTTNVLASQTTNPTRASGRAILSDCSSGDTHGIFGYYTALGSCVTDTGIYFTSTDAYLTNSSNTDIPVSWKIVTTANCSYFTPFKTPWIDWYHTGTSEITPYLEILRDGSATAYQDDEIWLELVAKVTSGSTLSTSYQDRLSLGTKLTGSPSNQDAGTDAWTGDNATHWAGKINSGTALTPAEKGYIRARICVGEPSITVYVDPQIRT